MAATFRERPAVCCRVELRRPLPVTCPRVLPMVRLAAEALSRMRRAFHQPSTTSSKSTWINNWLARASGRHRGCWYCCAVVYTAHSAVFCPLFGNTCVSWCAVQAVAAQCQQSAQHDAVSTTRKQLLVGKCAHMVPKWLPQWVLFVSWCTSLSKARSAVVCLTPAPPPPHWRCFPRAAEHRNCQIALPPLQSCWQSTIGNSTCCDACTTGVLLPWRVPWQMICRAWHRHTRGYYHTTAERVPIRHSDLCLLWPRAVTCHRRHLTRSSSSSPDCFLRRLSSGTIYQKSDPQVNVFMDLSVAAAATARLFFERHTAWPRVTEQRSLLLSQWHCSAGMVLQHSSCSSQLRAVAAQRSLCFLFFRAFINEPSGQLRRGVRKRQQLY